MSRAPSLRFAAGLVAACGCTFALGLASCGSSPASSSGTGATSGAGAGDAGTTSGTGATGGEDILGGGGGFVQATCTGGTTSTTTTSGGAGGVGGANSGCDGITGDAHFGADVGPILAGCTGELCHLTPGYADLVGVPATECCDGRLLVAPFDAARSYLLDKVKGTNLCYGGQMPFDAPALSDAETLAIARWICAGALDD